MSKFDGFIRSIKSTIVEHSPEILTGVGIAGMIATTIVAVKATPKAMQLIEEKKEELECDKLPFTETVKATWKCYLPAAITCATSTVCLIGASSVSARRNAALVTAYNISRTALSEYQEKVVEEVGEEKERVIREKVVQEKIDNNPVNHNEVIIAGKDTELFYDAMFGRYFKSDRNTVIAAMNEINRRLVAGDMYASLNEFYMELGMPGVDIGDYLGWNIDDRDLEVEMHGHIADDGRPCVAIGYSVAPHYRYDKYL